MEDSSTHLSENKLIKSTNSKEENDMINWIKNNIDIKRWLNFCFELIKANDDEFTRFSEKFATINYLLVKDYFKSIFPPNDISTIKTLDSFFKDNATNINKIICIIRSNTKELISDDYGEINIYCDEFKEICNTIIFFPMIYTEFVSGYLIFYLYHSDLKMKKDNTKKTSKTNLSMIFLWEKGLFKNGKNGISLEEFKQDKKYYNSELKRIKRKIFFDNHNSYLKKLEKDLKFNMHNLSKSPKNSLWKFMDLCKYIDHEFPQNNVKSQESSLFALWDVIFSGRSLNHVPNKYKKWFLLSTILFIDMSSDDRDSIVFMNSYFFKLLFSFIVLVDELTNYIQTLMIAKQDAGYKYAVEYYKLFTELEQWLQNKLSIYENYTNEDNQDEKLSDPPIINVNEKNLYLNVYWRKLVYEYLKIIQIMEGSLIVPQKNLNNEELQLYLASQPKENINVKNWDEFKDKYKYQLEIFFSSEEEDKQKEAWIYTVTACLFLSNMHKNFPIDDIKNTERISEKWLKKYEKYICDIKTSNLFSLMYIYIYASEVLVETKGKNTTFFSRILYRSTKHNSREKRLQDLIKSIKTHYTSLDKSDSCNLLFFQIIELISSQEDVFYMTNNIYVSFIKLKKLILQKLKKDVLFTRYIDEKINSKGCKKNSKKFYKWISNLRNELKNLREETKLKCIHYKEFLEKTNNNLFL